MKIISILEKSGAPSRIEFRKGLGCRARRGTLVAPELQTPVVHDAARQPKGRAERPDGVTVTFLALFHQQSPATGPFF